MSKDDEIKLNDLPIKTRIVNKHKKVWTALWIITFIIFSPFALLQVINEMVEKLINKVAVLRNKLVYTIFKLIYKKEIIANEKEIENLK